MLYNCAEDNPTFYAALAIEYVFSELEHDDNIIIDWVGSSGMQLIEINYCEFPWDWYFRKEQLVTTFTLCHI